MKTIQTTYGLASWETIATSDGIGRGQRLQTEHHLLAVYLCYPTRTTIHFIGLRTRDAAVRHFGFMHEKAAADMCLQLLVTVGIIDPVDYIFGDV